jgi:hypothetical protein
MIPSKKGVGLLDKTDRGQNAVHTLGWTMTANWTCLR